MTVGDEPIPNCLLMTIWTELSQQLHIQSHPTVCITIPATPLSSDGGEQKVNIR